MGSLFKSNSVATCCLATILAILSAPSVVAQTGKEHGTGKPMAPVVDQYYRAYPRITVADPTKETLVKRGEYLAKMGDCIACHSNVKGGTPAYAGGLPIDTPFGTFYSPNITPDVKTGIGSWTEDDFVRALKKGQDPKGRNYFPVFPYVYFANVSDDDARAMYAYFMSIPPVEQKNKPLPFPFSVPGARSTLLGWNLLFFYPNDHFEYDPKQSAVWNRGKYIVDGLGHCSMCHTPLNPLGAPKADHYLTGGFIDGYWAPNITKLGLESATEEEVANVFVKHELINNAGPVAGPMAEVNYDSLRYLNEADRLAIASYLKTVVSQETLGVPASKNPPTLRRGKEVYMSACIICHQNGAMSAPLIGSASSWYSRLKTSGLNGLYRNVINGYNSMPVKGACVICSENDIKASVDYILNKSLTRSQRIELAKGGSKTFPVSGQDIYKKNCSVCHDSGESGAPVIGDKKAWTPFLAQDLDALVEHTIKGKAHPKNGGCKQCTTAEIMSAVKYIVNQSKTEGNYSLW